jgi:hypothetical protein
MPGSTNIREKRTNSTSSISFLIVNYVPKLHVDLVGFFSLGTAVRVQFDRSNREESKTGRVVIPGCPVLRTNSTNSILILIVNYVPKLHVDLVGFVSLGTAAVG